MKELTLLFCIVLLCACTTTNYEELLISSAEISALEVEEENDEESGIHQLNIKFDYAIKQFNEGDDIYHCSVQFLTYYSSSVTLFDSDEIPCRIEFSSGAKSIIWNTPFNKNLRPKKTLLSKVKLPVQYFIAIHQFTSERSSRIIAKSDIMTIDKEF